MGFAQHPLHRGSLRSIIAQDEPYRVTPCAHHYQLPPLRFIVSVIPGTLFSEITSRRIIVECVLTKGGGKQHKLPQSSLIIYVTGKFSPLFFFDLCIILIQIDREKDENKATEQGL